MPATTVRRAACACHKAPMKKPHTRNRGAAMRDFATDTPYGPLQAKLSVGPANDAHEIEADRIADQVMRAQDASVGGRTSTPGTSRLPEIGPFVAAAAQRQADDEEDEEDTLQATATDGSGASLSAGSEALVGRARQGPGQLLPDKVRARMELAFGADFSAVRLHAGNDAATAAGAVRARAFTIGNDIVFGAGEKHLDTPAGQHLLAHELTHVVQQGGGSVPRLIQRDNGTATESTESHVAEKYEDGLTLSEILARAVMMSPRLMAGQAEEYVNDITEIFSEMEPGDLFFDRIHEVYWGFGALILELRRMPEGETTTHEQRLQAIDLARKWFGIQDDIEAHNEREARKDLEEARQAAEQQRIELLYAYHDIYTAGQDPEDVEVGSGNMKMLAEKTKDLLKAINDADASLSGRSVEPLIPVLDNTLSVVNLITGWKVTSGLASESEESIAALQNAWSLSTTALGLVGFGKFLPLFSHIGPLLDGIAKGWGRVVSQLQKMNRLWWEARDVLGEELPYPAAMPDGPAVFTYMRRVFRASEPLSGRPSDAVVDFFEKNREMFSKAATEVMGRSWAEVPTESSWLFWTKVDPDKLNRWVYYNRVMVWRLIYGRGMEPPE